MTDLVFGTGGRFGRLSYSLASSLVFSAIDHGIRYFDTGFEYCSRRSQPLLFDILSSHPEFASGSIGISTKFLAPQAAGQLTDLVDRSLFQLSRRDYLDTIFLWGPSLQDLNKDFLFTELSDLKLSGKIRGWGVNTHCSNVMSGILAGECKFPLDHIMVDYNLLQLDRELFINAFFDEGIDVWAGTALCQGFLSQSLLRMFLRTRSLSYLMRALLQPSTRRFLTPARILRQQLKTFAKEDAGSLPFAFVAANPSVSKIPIGMLSLSSILANTHVMRCPPPPSLLRKVSRWASSNCQL